MMDIWVLIPVKSLLQSKRRLSHLLAAEQRAELICGLLQRELSILNQVSAIERILVISSDPQVWEIARRNGALVEEEKESRGLNLAVTHGMAAAAEQGAAAVLILPVDLPFIAASDVELLIKGGQEASINDRRWAGRPPAAAQNGDNQFARLMVIASDKDGQGTNALLVTIAQGFEFQFGPGSFQKHLQEARKRGMISEVISSPGLQFDIDNERDWYTYQASKVSC